MIRLNETINKILELEWEMMYNVNNLGGAASCQRDPKTFKIMRSSQAETWNPELLESYYKDLKFAKASERNLITEKYGRMMKTTIPEEYDKIKDLLPAVDEETLEKIEMIIAIYLTL